MRTLVRYLIFFGVLVGLAYAAVSVEIGGETVYRRYHLQRVWPRASRWIEATWAALHERETPRPRMKPMKAEVKPDRRAKERVAILRRATREASPEIRRLPPKRKTSVDPPISARQKKALDEIVTSRVGRP